MIKKESESTGYYSPNFINREPKWINMSEMIDKIDQYNCELISFLESFNSEVSDLEDNNNKLIEENNDLKDELFDLKNRLSCLEAQLESID